MGENGDNNHYNNYDYNITHNVLDSHVRMATSALICGLISIPLFFFMNIGIILGGVAIVFALLSKGTAKKLLPQARKGIIYGTIGIILGYIVLVTSFHTMLTDPESRAIFNKTYEQINGRSFDDTLKELGISLDVE